MSSEPIELTVEVEIRDRALRKQRDAWRQIKVGEDMVEKGKSLHDYWTREVEDSSNVILEIKAAQQAEEIAAAEATQ